MARLEVMKTYKMYVGGKFVRSESGRTLEARSPDDTLLAHACAASRKDLRDAVRTARGAQAGWEARDAYNRGQILYRVGEMLEGREDELAKAVRDATGENLRETRREVRASVDRFVAYSGWADKFQHVLGCQNPVSGPFYNFTVPAASGVCVVVAPDAPALLPLVSLIAPALCAGCTVVAVGGSHAVPAALLGEVFQTSDVPPGVANVLTGQRAELLEWIAGHRDIDAVHAADLEEAEARTLRAGAAENVKRVMVRDVGPEGWFDDEACEGPWWIEPLIDFKTIWHPSGV